MCFSKPPYSFSCLIFMAIEDCPTKRLPVKDIYNWMVSHFPYFANAPTGWKNSVRHNLSLNKCFKKVDKDKGSVSSRFRSPQCHKYSCTFTNVMFHVYLTVFSCKLNLPDFSQGPSFLDQDCWDEQTASEPLQPLS